MSKQQNGFLCLIFILILSATLQAQSNVGRISGVVTDSSGGVIPGCSVTAENIKTGFKQTTASSEAGLYVFPGLPAGTYNLTAEMQGFKTTRQEGIVLDAASSRSANFELAVGAISEQVLVTAAADQVQTTSGDVARVIDDRQVEEIALNGRNYMQLLRLTVGAVATNSNAGASSTVGMDPFNLNLAMDGQRINGIRSTSIYATVDGFSNTDLGGTLNQAVNPSVDAVAEVRVLTASYSAEFGVKMGATINAVTKSGTKDFHGTLFYFVRNNALDARSFFASKTEPLHWNDFGGTFGGPLFIPGKFNRGRDKLFFFVAEEKKYNHSGLTQVGTVPTFAERNGNFQNSSLAAPVDPLTGQAFADRMVPQSRWSKNGPALLAPYPLPNYGGPGGNFRVTGINRYDTREDLVRVDYFKSASTQLSWRIVRDTWAGIYEAFQGTNLGNIGNKRPRPGYISSLNLSQTFSPTLLNSAGIGITHGKYTTTLNTENYLRSTLGLTYPELFPANHYGVGPGLTLTGFTSYSPTGVGFQSQSHSEFQINDDLSKTVGSHILKFGFLYMRAYRNAYPTGGTNGSVSFTGSVSKNAVADALLGNFFSYTEQQYSNFNHSIFNQYEFYAQDSWQVGKKFHLELGLRYSILPPNFFAEGNVNSFVPSLWKLSDAPQMQANGRIVAGTGNPYNGLALWGDKWPDAAIGRIPAASIPNLRSQFGSLPIGGAPTEHWNLGPRFGFAYDPFGDGKTAIRTGFGIFYDRIATDGTQNTNNPPFNTSATISNGNIDNPAGVGTPLLPPSISSRSQANRVPRVMSWNLNVQRQLTGGVIVDVGYVGNVGRHFIMTRNINQLPQGTLTRNPGYAQNALRPYPGYGDINIAENGENTSYNAMQITTGRRVSQGLSFTSNFTWSKTMDTSSGSGSGGGTLQDVYNAGANRALSDINRKYVFNTNLQYNLPFFRNGGNALARRILGGWSLSGVFSSQSGAPNSVTVPSDVAGIGVSSSRATLIGDPKLPSGDRTISRWFNTSAFQTTAQMTKGQFGNSGRNILMGPGFWQIDMSLFKSLTFKETGRFDFRAEFFNLLNHPSFFSIGTVVGTSTFGQITGALNGRVLQFGVKFRY